MPPTAHISTPKLMLVLMRAWRSLAEFLEAATDGRRDRAERMLALYPKIRVANLHTALVLGDASAVDARLERDPSLATRPGGPRGWARPPMPPASRCVWKPPPTAAARSGCA